MLHVIIRNDSQRKGLYRRNDLCPLAERICAGEGYTRDAELSVLLCDDPFIEELNRTYRAKNEPTDVLSFAQSDQRLVLPGGFTPLGDIVISLETVEQCCGGDRSLMRGEVRLLFCHGMLHLLGWTHATESDRQRMMLKQAQYLGVEPETAWGDPPLGSAFMTKRNQRL